MYTLYSAAIVLLFAILSPYFLYQAVRHRKYIRNLPQRLGYLPLSFNFDGDDCIWIHGVSVGEVLTARAVLPQLRERYPRLRIFLSATTRTGHHVARTNVHDVDGVFYFPLDLAPIVRRTLAVVKPRLFIMMETELWPNLLRECRRQGVKTVLVNGRISARSFPRYRLARRFFRRVLADVDRFCMQSEESARRIIEIGAPRERVSVTGSLKFDSLEIPGASVPDRGHNRVLRYFRIPPERPVIIAASTLRGEEEPVLEAFQRIRATWSNALLIIAPRKPERFDDVERLARQPGWRVARRTELAVDAEPRVDVVVLDTIGELAQLYQVATVVFVGGSLADAGGHNILEPAVFGKPIVFGPHMHNFAEISQTFIENRGAVQVHSEAELETVLVELLSDPVRRAGLGAAARALVEANRGARARTLAVITQLLPSDASGTVLPFRAL
jgi:3-deoxy-D-manno-octulosonic-acid transferase